MGASQLLRNKVIVITGGNSGIGYAVAEKVIAEGGIAVIVGKDHEKISLACDQLGKCSIGFKADVTQINEIDNLYHSLSEQFPTIHGVVVNAGVAIFEPCKDVTVASFDQSIITNLKGAFFTAQKAVPLMKETGGIVFISSLAAHRAIENTAIYALTKAALLSLTASMSLEFAPIGIRVNSISPGTIETPIYKKLGMSDEKINEFVTTLKGKIPLRRVGQSYEIANVVAFLLSDQSTFVTGTNILADGGVASSLV